MNSTANGITPFVLGKIDQVISSRILSEYLVPFNPTERIKQAEAIGRFFMIAPFDTVASIIAAELVGNKELLKDLQEKGADRQKLKIDTFIVGIAIAQNAERIISHDPHLKRIAQDRISVEEVP